MYDALRTNLPKEIMAFTDFSFDADIPSFMTHQEVLRYLQRYAEHYGLAKHVAFCTVVEKVAPLLAPDDDVTNPRWRIETRDLITSNHSCEDFDYVLICNGHYSKPFIPPIPGLESFPGCITHSHQYRKPSPFKDQTVLVIGDGFSGTDIMLDIAAVSKRVYLSNSHKPMEVTLPQNVEQVSRVTAIIGNTVCTEERSLEVTCLIFCTGYLYHAPFLTENCGVMAESKRVHPCYHHTFNATYPSMAFIGLNIRVIPFPCFDLQVQWVMAVWRGDKLLPSRDEMVQQCCHDYRLRLERGMPAHFAHYMGTLQWDFYEQLAAMGGAPPLDPTVKEIYDIVSHRRLRDIQTYRDELNQTPPW
eukprot:Em0018g1045a